MNTDVLTNKEIEFASAKSKLYWKALLMVPYGNECSELLFEPMFNGTEPCWRPLIPTQTDYSFTEERTSGFI